MIKNLLRDSVTYVIPSIVNKAISILLIPLYTQILTPSDFGYLDILLIFANFIVLTVTLEIIQGLAFYYTTEHDSRKKIEFASTAFTFTLFCYSILCIFLYHYSTYFTKLIFDTEILLAEFQIGIVYIWLNGINYFIQNQFRWEFRSKQYALNSILVAVSTAISSIILIYYLSKGLWGIIAGMAIGSAIGVLYGLWHVRNTLRLYIYKAPLKAMLTFYTSCSIRYGSFF